MMLIFYWIYAAFVIMVTGITLEIFFGSFLLTLENCEYIWKAAQLMFVPLVLVSIAAAGVGVMCRVLTKIFKFQLD